MAEAELGVTGLAGTLTAVVIEDGALALVLVLVLLDWIEVEGAVEVDMDGAPSLIAAMEGWFALGLRLCECDHELNPSSGPEPAPERGGVDNRGGVVACMIMAEGGADMPLNDVCEEESGPCRGENWLRDDETDPGRRSSVMAWAMRSRLPNAGISSSLSKFASSSSSRSPVISCSVVSASPSTSRA